MAAKRFQILNYFVISLLSVTFKIRSKEIHVDKCDLLAPLLSFGAVERRGGIS